jgi:hypothetical protein
LHQPKAAPPEAHHDRVAGGIATVQIYLKAQFPQHIIEILKETPDDAARKGRTFNIRTNGQRYLLRVADDVLDLGPEGVASYLRRFQIAPTLRQDGAGRVVVITTTGLLIEEL